MSEKKSFDFLVAGGAATAGPPIGSALGPLGVNVPAIVESINKATKEYAGMRVPVRVVLDPSTKVFEVHVGTPTTSALIVRELGVQKGSGKPGVENVGNLSLEQVLKIARLKKGKSLAYSIKGIVKEALGSCASMGVTVEGKAPREVALEIDAGKHDSLFED